MTDEYVPILCYRCLVKMTDDELKENTEENPTCRRCTKRMIMFNDFREHQNDEEYFDRDDIPNWERWAYRIINDAEDTPVLLSHLAEMVKVNDITDNDYRKIIELLANAYVQAQYDENLQELPR